MTGRIHATSGNVNGGWPLATITSITPASAKPGDTFTLTINGTNLQRVSDAKFRLAGVMMGGGMMGRGSPTYGEDPNITATNVQANAPGTQVTASFNVLAAAVIGTRQIQVTTNHGMVMGGMQTFAVQ